MYPTGYGLQTLSIRRQDTIKEDTVNRAPQNCSSPPWYDDCTYYNQVSNSGFNWLLDSGLY